MPEPMTDGRTGRVSAGCVFWSRCGANLHHFTARSWQLQRGQLYPWAAQPRRSSHQHRYRRSRRVGLGKSGGPSASIPAVTTRPAFIAYGPLAETLTNPSVILLRLNAQGMMIVADALRSFGSKASRSVTSSRWRMSTAGSLQASVALWSRANRNGCSRADMCHPGAMAADVTARVERAAGVDDSDPLRGHRRSAFPLGRAAEYLRWFRRPAEVGRVDRTLGPDEPRGDRPAPSPAWAPGASPSRRPRRKVTVEESSSTAH